MRNEARLIGLLACLGLLGQLSYQPMAAAAPEPPPLLRAPETREDARGTEPPSYGVELDASPEEADKGTKKLIALVVLFMAITTAVAVATSFYLYRWRRILISQPERLVPEEWGKYLENVGREVRQLTGGVASSTGNLTKATKASTHQISDMVDTFGALRDALEERDAEIRRLKRGYDADVFRKFLRRFIRVDQFAKEFLTEEGHDGEPVSQVRRLLLDAFDDCGVEEFAPEIGDDSRTAEGIADNPKTVEAEREADDFRIVEVIDAGYRLRHGDSYEILVPAKVKISVFSRRGG